MEWILADIVIPTRTLEAAGWAVVGYIIAAIGWGFRVELKLAKLDRDQIATNSVVDAIKTDVRELRAFADDSRVHQARVDERLVKIMEALERK